MNNSTLIPMNASGDDGCEVTKSLNECMWKLPHSKPEAAIITVLYIIIFLTAFLWNSLVIFIFLKDRKLLKYPSSVFLLGLAIIDFLEAVLSIPFYVAALIGGGWIFGDTDKIRQGMCTAIGFFLSIFLLMSVHLLALISFDRFLNIVFAIKYDKLMNPWRALLLAFFVCIVPLILASTPFFGFGMLGFSDTVGVCIFRWAGHRFYVIMIGVEALLPITAIIVFTLWTYIYIKQFLNKRHERRLHFVTTEQERRELSSKKTDHQRTLTKAFTLLLVTQLMCFTPGILWAFIGFFIGYYSAPPIVPLFCFVVIISNAAINPLIQSLARTSFRRYLSRFIKTITCGRFCAGIEEQLSGFGSDQPAVKGSQIELNRFMSMELVGKENGQKPQIKRTLSDQFVIDPVNGTVV